MKLSTELIIRMLIQASKSIIGILLIFKTDIISIIGGALLLISGLEYIISRIQYKFDFGTKFKIRR